MSEWELVGSTNSKPSSDGWEAVGVVNPKVQEVPVQAPVMPPTGGDIVSRNIANPMQQTTFETQLQGTSAGVNALMEQGAEMASPYIIPVMQYISESTPDEIKIAIERTNNQFMQSPSMRLYMAALEQGGKAFEQFEKANPRLAMDAKAALNIGTLAAGGIVGGRAYASKLYNEALKGAVKPYMNQANMGEMLKDGRLKPGGITKIQFVKTDAVKQQMAALRTVEGIRPAQTNIARFQLINDEIKRASIALEDNLDALAKSGRGMIGKHKVSAALSKKSIKNRFNRMSSDRGKALEYSQFMKDPEYETVLKDLQFRLQSKRADGAVSVGDVHRARKQMDIEYRNKKNENRFQGKNETREERIWKLKRDILNDMIDRTAPMAKSERSRISTLYDVNEIIFQKTIKGQAYFYKDITDRVPLLGDSKVKITPTMGK